MRGIAILLMLSISAVTLQAQSVNFGKNSIIYLVRHAEKGTGADPLLTTAGNKRAGDLMRVLQNKNIRRIYVTEYKRTQNTGDSLRIGQQVDTVHYFADTAFSDLLNKIRFHKDLDNTILIIGHSNTIPLIIRKLGLTDYAAESIADKEFDNLYIITRKGESAIVTKVKYGDASAESATMH
ncbi:MAG: histidine phosphatase family protein [Ferruginibacter sp.]